MKQYLRLGLDFQARSPNTAITLASIKESGGFSSANQGGADYELFGRLSFSYGISFLPFTVGRYRLGHEQFTNVSTPERAEMHLRDCAGAAKSLRAIGCKPEIVNRLVDQMAWGLFLSHAGRWRDSTPKVVCRLFEVCSELSQGPGPMRSRAQREYPVLFWQPRRFAHLLYAALEGSGYRVTKPERIEFHPTSIWKNYSTSDTRASNTSTLRFI